MSLKVDTPTEESYYLHKMRTKMGDRLKSHLQYITYHMMCLKMSSGLVRNCEPSGAEGLPPVLFDLEDNLLKTSATLAAEELAEARQNLFKSAKSETALGYLRGR